MILIHLDSAINAKTGCELRHQNVVGVVVIDFVSNVLKRYCKKVRYTSNG
jgi:hypothetical protein